MTDQKKTVLVFSSTYPRWENDTSPPFVHELTKRLVADFNIIVLAPHYPGALTREKMDGVSIFRYRYFLGKFEILAGETSTLPTLKKKKHLWLILPFFILSGLFHLLYLCAKFKVDLVHAHWVVPQGLQATLIWKLTKVPFIVTSHGADIFGTQGRIWHLIKKMVFNNARAITAVSKKIKDEIHVNFSSTSIEIVSMGVDSQLFSPVKKNPALRKHYGINGDFLLFTGRLSEKKGVTYLIQAMPLVIQSHPQAKLLIVGKGELKSELHKLVKKLRLEEIVTFTGAVPNKKLPSFYATADLFIAPSTKTNSGDIEGFGLTFVEASMAGCLIVGTKSGGICDILIDKETGFLVEDKNSAQLAETIIYVLLNKDALQEIRVKARQRAIAKFDWPVIAAKYSEILSNALGT
jgi:glycosyltransferase involved in cell wall biosynthesis